MKFEYLTQLTVNIGLHKIMMLHNQKIQNNKTLQADYRYNTTSGFTLLEMLVVILIIAVLSAIAAPSWLTFLMRQRVSKGNDIVLSALQQAQSEAKKQKISYSAWFRENNGELEYAVVPSEIAINTLASQDPAWKSIGEELGIDAKQIIARTNLTGDNTAGASATNTLATPRRIVFDYRGTLADANFGTSGLKLVLAVPSGTNLNQPSDTKRCVIVQTLLGGMSTEQDDKCN